MRSHDTDPASTSEETELVRSACLTVAVTLGAYLGDVVIVGGLVPSLLIDSQRAEPTEADDDHPGTNDLDLGLSLAVLDDQRYTEISARLRAEGFEPDQNAAGNPTVQRWRLGELKVDFLMPPAPGQDPTRRVQNLEPDFGALVTRGLELAFNEREQVTIVGRTLAGEKAMREVPVCGPGGLPSVMGAVPAWRVVRPGSCVGPGDALPSGGSRVAKRVNRVTIRARRSCRHRQARRRAFWVCSGCTK